MLVLQTMRYVMGRKRAEVFYNYGRVVGDVNHPGGFSSPQMKEKRTEI